MGVGGLNVACTAADYGRVVELCKFMRFLSRRLRVANPNVQPVALSG